MTFKISIHVIAAGKKSTINELKNTHVYIYTHTHFVYIHYTDNFSSKLHSCFSTKLQHCHFSSSSLSLITITTNLHLTVKQVKKENKCVLVGSYKIFTEPLKITHRYCFFCSYTETAFSPTYFILLTFSFFL